MDAYLAAAATSDDRSEGTSEKMSRHILQNPLPPNIICRATFCIANLGLREFGLQRIRKRSGDVHFNIEIPNGNIGGMDVGEGKVLLVVIRDLPIRFRRFVE